MKINFDCLSGKWRLLSWVIVLSIIFMPSAKSQTDQRQQVIDRLQQLATKYLNTGYLSFDVKYTYSEISSPAIHLDSVQGSFKMNKGDYWYRLDSTESITNDSTTLTVFKEDKLIYISRSTTSRSNNPLAMIDSAISYNQYNSFSLSKSAAGDVVTLEFKPGFPYKNMVYVIDPNSGFVTSITAMIKADQLNDPTTKSMFKSDEYGILRIDFTNYKTSGISSNDFSESNYVSWNGNSYQPVAALWMYQIINSKN
jgi:hypothetical protein